LLPRAATRGIWRLRADLPSFDFWSNSMRKIVSLAGVLAASILALIPVMLSVAT